MKTELEAKFLDIDPVALRDMLSKIGAKNMSPEILMKRRVFDFPDQRLRKIGGWVRVRDEGDKITLSYKQLNDRSLHGTKEINVEVNDFDSACRLLEAIGLKAKSYQETKRKKWIFDNVEITIDTWPWIPCFVELEGENEGQLRSVAGKLGLDWSKAMHGSVETAYQKYYDVTEEEVDSWPEITFTDVPDWLEAKRR